MKKILAIILTLVLAMSLSACGGGVDTTAATESYNTAITRMNEVADIVNPNAQLLGDEFMDEMIAASEEMELLKNELESEDITQERADEIDVIAQEYLATFDDFEARAEEMISDPSLAKIQTINDLIISLTDAYNEVAPLAIENGWEADDLTVEELNAFGSFVEFGQSADFDASVAALEEADLDALIEQCEVLQAAVPAILEKVSQPYTDEM